MLYCVRLKKTLSAYRRQKPYIPDSPKPVFLPGSAGERTLLIARHDRAKQILTDFTMREGLSLEKSFWQFPLHVPKTPQLPFSSGCMHGEQQPERKEDEIANVPNTPQALPFCLRSNPSHGSQLLGTPKFFSLVPQIMAVRTKIWERGDLTLSVSRISSLFPW